LPLSVTVLVPLLTPVPPYAGKSIPDPMFDAFA
jgi:hypothetical protein